MTENETLKLVRHRIENEMKIIIAIEKHIKLFEGSTSAQNLKRLRLISDAIIGRYLRTACVDIENELISTIDSSTQRNNDQAIANEVEKRLNEITEINLSMMSGKERNRVLKTVAILDQMQEDLKSGKLNF